MATSFETILAAITAAQADVVAKMGIIPSVGGTNNNLRAVTLVPPTGYSTVTGGASNTVTLSVRYRRANGSPVVVATKTLGASDTLVADTKFTIPVTSATATSLKPGDVVEVFIHQEASGVAVGAGVLASVEID